MRKIVNRIRHSHLLLIASYLIAGVAFYYALKYDSGSDLNALGIVTGILVAMIGLPAFYAPCQEGEEEGIYTL